MSGKDTDNTSQEGGKKNFSILMEHMEKKKLQLVKQGLKVPSDKAIRDSLRSFTAELDGVPLGDKRYFHGSPTAAARKVISMVNRQIKEHEIRSYTTKKGKVMPARHVDEKLPEFDTVGKEHAVRIKLTEVTKGVLKSNKVLGADGKNHREHYTYEYFGWRVPASTGFSRGGKQIAAGFKNVVLPARKGESLAEAERAAATLAARPAVAGARAKLRERNAELRKTAK
jgi:hypothetical protein